MVSVYFQTEEIEDLLAILYNFNKIIGILVESKKCPKDPEVNIYMKLDWIEQLMEKVLNEGQELKEGVLESAKEIGLSPQ